MGIIMCTCVSIGVYRHTSSCRGGMPRLVLLGIYMYITVDITTHVTGIASPPSWILVFVFTIC